MKSRMRVSITFTCLLVCQIAWSQAPEVAPTPVPAPVSASEAPAPAAPPSPVKSGSGAASSKAAHAATSKLIPIIAEQQTAFIVFESPEDHSKDPNLVKKWKEFCEQLGKGMSLTSTPEGFLSSSTCLPLGITEQPSKAPSWRFRIIEQKRFFEIEASYLQKPEGYVKVRSYSFRFEGDLLQSLESQLLPLTIARMFAEGLPLGWSYVHDASQKNIVFKLNKNLPKLPKNLLVYELSFDPKKKLWIPSVRAILQAKSSKPADLMTRAETYELSQAFLPMKDKQRYWIQNTEGLSKQQAEYEKVLSAQMKGVSILSFLDRLIFDSFDSNYGGFRYGKSFLQGESIVTEADLITILVEMRSGLFSGLRWYYDLSPQKSRGSGDDEEFFRMSRASLGWAFNFEMPAPISMLVSRVEVQPKFGLLDISTKFSVLSETEEKVALLFDAKNVYDLAMELGVEKESYWFRSRLWASFSAAMFGLSNPSKTSVLSSKAGIDAYFDVLEWGNNWDLNILTFAMGERLVLGKEGGEINEEAALGIAEVEFNLFFVGGGFTLSW